MVAVLSLPSSSDLTSNFPRDRLPRAIFLDSGGVINDNSRRAPQWIQLLEEYMPKTMLGGPGPMWGRANAILVERLFKDNMFDQIMAESANFDDFDRRYSLYWIQNTVVVVNQFLKEEYEQEIKDKDKAEGEGKAVEPKLIQLVLPESEDEQCKIARGAHLHCTSLVRADYPGAVDAILSLKFEHGFEMYTCSGETSVELELTFLTLGISTLEAPAPEKELEKGRPRPQPVFKTLYGPDLIDCPKLSSLYYERIFQDSGVDPRDAVVVDDKEHILGWAKVHGARTVLISDKDRTGKELMVEQEERGEGEDGVEVVRKRKVLAVDHQLSSLAELPALTTMWRKHLETTTSPEAA
ncbi:hypothetical protein BGX26_008694 [Mortierella sp. AD094]|nr:hypothetical protein BGX26_008694 [Mortierella sp. AD094]